jgi:CRP/FNR family cyclic AMP-dependent transcriptional regulator
MTKSKRAPTLKPAGVLDWTGVPTQRVQFASAAMIFAQGDPATSVMYVEKGAVRLSVLSHAGKEAVVAVLDEDHFFGEGCLAGQSLRMATATAMAACTILAVEKQEMVRQLHARPAFADRWRPEDPQLSSDRRAARLTRRRGSASVLQFQQSVEK